MQYMTKWESEITGYIWGEGTIGVYSYTTKKNEKQVVYFRPVVKIVARDDDSGILEEIHKTLGGYLYHRKLCHKQKGGYTSNPSVSWTAQDFATVKKVCGFLKESILPSKKKRLLPLMDEFFSIAGQGAPSSDGKNRGKKYSQKERERILEIIKEQKAIRRYMEQQQI